MTEQDLQERVSQLVARIDGLELTDPIRQTIGDLRNQEQWDWSSEAGIYYFVRDGTVVYVGRAYPSHGIGNRIGSHVAPTDDAAWSEIINDDQTIVGVYPFPSDDWHWIASLEVHLIDVEPRPEFNKRL